MHAHSATNFNATHDFYFYFRGVGEGGGAQVRKYVEEEGGRRAFSGMVVWYARKLGWVRRGERRKIFSRDHILPLMNQGKGEAWRAVHRGIGVACPLLSLVPG